MPTDSDLDMDRLLKFRLLVARFGEMDQARWWNTRGVLGPVGEMALRRGFSKTHLFAQARLVFAVASHRCRSVYDPPQSITLWNLPVAVEDQFEIRWTDWIASAEAWKAFFRELHAPKGTDLLTEAGRLDLADDELLREARQLKRAAENRAVPIPASTDQATGS